MKVFVWERIKQVSDNYHAAGGLVVFAETEARARELANSTEGCNLMPDELPDDIRDVTGGDERVFIMPDAGCC